MDKRELGIIYIYLSISLFVFQYFCQCYTQESLSIVVKWGWLLPLIGGFTLFSLDFLLQNFNNHSVFFLPCWSCSIYRRNYCTRNIWVNKFYFSLYSMVFISRYDFMGN